MKISARTKEILENFAGINETLHVLPGSKLRTKDSRGSLLAEAVVEEVFPEICITDLPRFMSALNLDKDAEIDVDGNYVVISSAENNSKINYRMGSTKHVAQIKEFNADLSNPGVKFDLPYKLMTRIQKVSNMLLLPNMAIESDGNKVSFKIFDNNNTSESVQRIVVGDAENEKKFSIMFLVESLNFVPAYDYKCAVYKGFAHFSTSDGKLVYWVSPELDSVYPDDNA